MAVEVNIAGAEMAGWEAKNRKEWHETGAKFLAISYPLGIQVTKRKGLE
jgi:hypothetical protein